MVRPAGAHGKVLWSVWEFNTRNGTVFSAHHVGPSAAQTVLADSMTGLVEGLSLTRHVVWGAWSILIGLASVLLP